MQHPACTTILVGKQASLDKSVMVARTEDLGSEIIPQCFSIIKPENQPQHYQSAISKQRIADADLTSNQPLQYTCIPAADTTGGSWAAGGINTANVAMTATETIIHFNPRLEGIDPCLDSVNGGLGEEDFVTLLLPYLHTAREGVQRAGYLVKKYGTYERSGMAFADLDELWYFETIGGHHWTARRIPDDACVIATNRLNIDQFRFDDPDFACSDDLKQLIDDNHLNPDPQGYNMRHIFGSADTLDAHYNNPRAWYAHKFFNPRFTGQPGDQDQPFIYHANRKLSIEDLEWLESSHYQETPYDPYGKTGTPASRWALRPIGINQTVETHILQLRGEVPQQLAGIHWVSFGPNVCNCLTPFYASGQQVPAAYQTTTDFDLDKVFWLEQFAALIGDFDHDLFASLGTEFLDRTRAACRGVINQTDQQITTLTGPALIAALDQANDRLARLVQKNTLQLLHQMLVVGHRNMRLRYNLFDLPENRD
jgi:dipeptidase